jgi:hypothetical protein
VITPTGRAAPAGVQPRGADQVTDGSRAQVAAGVRTLSPVHWPTLSASETIQLQLGQQEPDDPAPVNGLSPLAEDFAPGVRNVGDFSPESEGEWRHLIECDELGLAAQEYIDDTAQREEIAEAASEAIPAAAEDAVSTPSTVSLPSPMSPSPEEQGSGPSQPVPGCGATSGEEGDGQLPAGQASSLDRVDDVAGDGVDSQDSGPVPRPRPTVRPQSSPRVGTQAQRRVSRATVRCAWSLWSEVAGGLASEI